MEVSRLLWLSIFFLLAFSEAFSNQNETFSRRLRRGRSLQGVSSSQSSSVLCNIMLLDVEYGGSDDAFPPSNDSSDDQDDGLDSFSHVCVTDRNDGALDMAYDVVLPDQVAAEVRAQSEQGFATHIQISDGVVVDDQNATLQISEQAHVDVLPHDDRRRRLTPTKGKSTVLVLRVIYRGISPSLSVAQLAGSVFGLGERALDTNLRHQIDACSFGKLQFVPAEGDGITNGVADISITTKVSGDNSVRVLDNLVVDKANQLFGTLRDNFEHVIVVLPDAGLKYGGRGFLAYGFLNGYRTVFHDRWAGRISALAHEIGHNFNLHHSGDEDGVHYGDESGYMGFGTSNVGYPSSCFNAQKNWALGFYEDRALSLDVEDLPWGGYLAAFPHYDQTTSDQHVLINVGTSKPRLFLQYNRATKMNAETREMADLVVIVRDAGKTKNSVGLQSWREAGIGLRDDYKSTYRYKNFHGTGFALVIKVCEQVDGPPDYVRLSIHLADGVQRHSCGAGQDPPVPPPTDPSTESCENDWEGSFYVDEKRGLKTCTWLARNIDKWHDTLCVPGKDSFDMCEETCGKCSDNCSDTPNASFFVNNNVGEKNCDWLSTRLFWQGKLCVDDRDVFDLCRESCNNC